jgi:hypothetical protein
MAGGDPGIKARAPMVWLKVIGYVCASGARMTLNESIVELGCWMICKSAFALEFLGREARAL